MSKVRPQWILSLLQNSFGKYVDENKIKDDYVLTDKIDKFLKGTAGQTLLVYCQRPYKISERNEKVETSQEYTIYVNESKNLELRNKAIFFIRMIPKERECTSENDIYMGEMTEDAIVSMNKIIFNYLHGSINDVDEGEWGEIEEEQKAEFVRILEGFAKDMNETVNSLVNGVDFAPLPQHIKDFIQKDNKGEFASDPNDGDKNEEIAAIYRKWIKTLGDQVDEQDKEPTNSEDVGPKSELERWKGRMQKLTSVNDFFKSQDFRMVTKYFNDPKVNHANSVTNLINEIKKKKMDCHTAHNEAKDNMKYLSTLEIYFEPLYNGVPDTIVDSLQSLMNSLRLISYTARYYDNTKMTNLFSKITDQMILTCKYFVLDKKLNKNNEDPTYLWEQDPDDLIKKFQSCTNLYNKYKEKYKDAKQKNTSTNKENNFEFGEHQLFGKFDQFCKRLSKLTDLFTTIKQFNDIKRHKLDSMESIEDRYSRTLSEFQNKTARLLDYNVTKFDKDYTIFNLEISEIESELHKIINDEFKNLISVEKKINLLEKYEKILTKKNLKESLKTEKIEIFSNYKKDIDTIQGSFETDRQSPKLQRNMPKISGKIKWAKHLFSRIYPYISHFKEISMKDRTETHMSYLMTNTLIYSYIILNERHFEKFVEAAKSKLNLPLLVLNQGQDPKVNLDLFVLELIREAKCMVRMGSAIPETAKIILLQEEKFKRYYNELTFLCKEYVRIFSRFVRSDAEIYFAAHKQDLNTKMEPLKNSINWSSMNIDSNLQGVFQCLNKLEFAVDAFFDILENRIHRNMNSIRRLELLNIPDDATKYTIYELIRNQESWVEEKNKILKSKNIEIENAILDIIKLIKSYEIDPKAQPKKNEQEATLFKLMIDYEQKFKDFLTTTTKNALNNLKERIEGSNEDKTYPAIFNVNINLVGGTIEMSPKINVIEETNTKLGKSVLAAMKGINSWDKKDGSERYSFHTVISNNNQIMTKTLSLKGSFNSLKIEIDNYLKETFEEFRHLWSDSVEKKMKEFSNIKNKNFYHYEERLLYYSKIEEQIEAIKEVHTIGAVSLNKSGIKNTLLHYCREWKSSYSKDLLRTTRNTSKELKSLIDNFDHKLQKHPEKIEELKEMVDTISEIRSQESEIAIKIKPFVQYYNLVKQHTKESDFERYNFPTKEDFETKWKDVLAQSAKHRDELKKNQISFRRKLHADVNKLKDDVNKIKDDYENSGPTKAVSPIDAYERLEKFRTRVAILKRSKKAINDGEEIFNFSTSDYPDLDRINKDLKDYGTLYDLYMAVIRQIENWKDMAWAEAKELLDDMEKRAAEFKSLQIKVNPRLKSTPENAKLKQQIEELNIMVEVFKQLNCPAFEDIHWQEIADCIKAPSIATAKSDGGMFRLKVLIDAGISDFREKIDEVVNVAVAQQKIKNGLDGIDDYWRATNFTFVDHTSRKDLQVLETLSFLEIKTNLEEHSGKIAGYKSQQRNLTQELNQRIKSKEQQFQNIMNTMELWYTVQSLWGSLQSFFIGGDIRKDLPGVTKQFEQADKDWLKLMDKAVGTKSVIALCSGTELAPVLTDIDKILKICQKNLNNYLENKRGAFPRFYFVSNELLLDILSKRSDPSSIRSNLKIMFDSLTDIDFSELDKKTIVKIIQTKGEGRANTQEVELLEEYRVKCDGKIEDWLNDLVKAMQKSIQYLFGKAYFDIKMLFESLDTFENFVTGYIGQVTVFGLMLIGTKKLEEFVQRTSKEDGDHLRKRLIENRNKDTKEGKDITDLTFVEMQSILTELCTRSWKNKLEMVKLEALIIVHVHNRDIFDFILNQRDHAITVNDYDWLKQTRVYWDTKYKTCIINITDVPFEYAYEFLGSYCPLCITELTDKCYITLAQALGMNYGGAPAGPAGTGKTETVKDMGRSMGVFVLVTNCAPEHRYRNMAEIFKGLCRAGAWGCFDEFNRILLPVLSVVAMIISSIQETQKEGKNRFKFPDSSQNQGSNPEIELLPTTAYFITMNPGYSGRQELPENLKVLFRGVTMMVPDRQAIIRVKLSSYGFMKNDDLAKKFNKLYFLCEDQLSKQKHYDFGLRNILAVLRNAGEKKKKDKKLESEERIIFQALRDMNVAKYVPDDIILFESLIKDVFPTQDYSIKEQNDALYDAVLEVMDRRNIHRDCKGWIGKLIQVYETSLVRHGFMIIGDTGSGKTTITDVLLEAMSDLGGSDKNLKWKTHRMNPRGIEDHYVFIQKLNDLYILGVFTMLWKKCNETTFSKGHNWLICDGPIDSIWIETLNTVLDDNKILTLSNNDRIQMAETCKLVCEAENLKNATLATVSRCGMIYMTEDDLGWRPLVNSWFLKNKDLVKDLKGKEENELKLKILKKYLTDEFVLQLAIDPNLDKVMDVSFMILLKNFFLLIEANLQQYKPTLTMEYAEKVVVFALCWGIGSIYEPDGRRHFHEILYKKGAPIPQIEGGKTVFEMALSPEGKWEDWAVDQVKITDADVQNFSQLLIPTMDSTRAMYLIESVSQVNVDITSDRVHPSLMLGDAGTAKTSTILLYKKLRFNENKVLKRINFSSATSPMNFQETIDAELDKGAGEYVPFFEKHMVFFIDEISMPYVNKWGDQMTLELARQVLEFGGYYFLGDSDDRGTMKKLARISFLAAMNHPKGGKNNIPNRLKRHFYIFNMVLPNETSVNAIYGKIMEKLFPQKRFGEEVTSFTSKFTGATIEMLNKMKATFITTPIKFHYSFNMRELSRVFQGIINSDGQVIKNATKMGYHSIQYYLTCLWKHEILRVFCDKLVDLKDKEDCMKIVDTIIATQLGDLGVEIPAEPLFTDYLREQYDDEESGRRVFPKNYEMVSDMAVLKERSFEYMEALKQERKKKHVNIVLFEDCLKNIIKITRVIQTPQGSCMVVGVGGSGKQSLCRLSAYISQHQSVQLSSDKCDRLEELKIEFRTIYANMIEEYNPVQKKDLLRHTFLFTDAELKLDSYLESVSSFLSTGEIANLFAKKEDKLAILSSMRSYLTKKDPKKEYDDNAVSVNLTNTVRDNLHVCLLFSPSSEKFRQKFIKFPVLFNNCTIIWLLPWPEEALISVCKGFFEEQKDFTVHATEDQKINLFKHMAGVHTSIKQACSQYLEKMRKNVYVTPKSYLSFIEEYIKLYRKKDAEISSKENLIKTGLDKLKQAEHDIEKEKKKLSGEMEKLKVAQEKVAKKEQEIKLIVDNITIKAKDANEQKQACEKDAKQIGAEQVLVEKELAEAEPVLKAAISSMKIDKSHVSALAAPGAPPLIKYYFETAALIMNKRLEKLTGVYDYAISSQGRTICYNDSSEYIKYYIASGDFLATLNEWNELIKVNKLVINDETLELLKPLLASQLVSDKETKLLFKGDTPSKAGGDAGNRLAKFCVSIESYVLAVKDVVPKKIKLDEKSAALEKANKKLEEVQRDLNKVEAEKKEKEDELMEVKASREAQEEKAEKMKKFVDQASHLIESLANEKERWEQDAKEFERNRRELLGDAAVCSAFIGYCGPFNRDFRDLIVRENFRKDIEDRGLPISQTDEPDLFIANFLVDETTKGAWTMNKLPSDTLSIQNGILVDFSSRYPLLIDPQNQARTWLLTSYPEIETNKQIFGQTVLAEKFEIKMTPLLEYGEKIVVEGIENEVDTRLDPVLEKQLLPGGGKLKKLMVGEKTYSFNEEFKMYLLCKLINPHFTPELSAKTTIIDFNVTIDGLAQQLQGIVISMEQKHLEETLKNIMTDITRNKNSLIQCQKEILDNLNKEADLMNNPDIIVVLNNSKTKSDENTKKIKEAEDKKIDINIKREKYYPVAIRGSVLYFSMVDMQEISKMYSTSLQQFTDLFCFSIENAVKATQAEKRVKNIVFKLTEHVYKYIVRGLFEKHKTAFILIVCFKILMMEKTESGTTLLNPNDVSLFIKAGASINAGAEDDCTIDILTKGGEIKPKEYLNLLAICRHKFNNNLHAFSKLEDKIRDNKEKFETFFESQDPENNIPYDDLFNQGNPKLVAFLKFVFVRALRSDRTIIAATELFIPKVLEDEKFLAPYPERISDYLEMTDARTPILYLLSAGADPSANIEELGRSRNKVINRVSMGENQEIVARAFVESARENGEWVLLQNCHLGLEYMVELETTLKNYDIDFDPEFRVWLSCEPSQTFPIGLLHQAFKVTNEPPKGIKSSMIKTYSTLISQTMIDKYEYKEWRNFIFTLTFLHSLVLERRKYGPLGWCIPYDFNNSDLESSILFVDKQFQKGLEISEKMDPSKVINFKTLVNVVSTILYGGRITDRKDGELFKTIIQGYLDESFFTKSTIVFYQITKDKADNHTTDYKCPEEAVVQTNEYVNHISNFSKQDPPGVFGLHSNADLTFRLGEFNSLLTTIQETLPKEGGGGGAGMSKEQEVNEKVEMMLKDMPERFKEEHYRQVISNLTYGSLKGRGLEIPLHNVLLQEIIAIQGIADLVKKSLQDMVAAISGKLMMTDKIVDSINSIYEGKPPYIWMYNANGEEISWISPFYSAWFEGLKIRAVRLAEWLNTDSKSRPPFYLPGFLNPQGFLGAFKQEVYKVKKSGSNSNITLDSIYLTFNPEKEQIDPTKPCNFPSRKNAANMSRETNMIIYGLFIEGATWNGQLQDNPDPNSRETIVAFPVIQVIGDAETQSNQNDRNKASQANTQYRCPVYKYPKRTDKYFITEITLKTAGGEQDERYWQKRGVAMLCNKE